MSNVGVGLRSDSRACGEHRAVGIAMRVGSWALLFGGADRVSHPRVSSILAGQ